MTKRTDIQNILIIGAGPIVIGQACEFDYSGTQACKALKEEGYRVTLINSNPATIMTDPEVADATYIEPITPEVVEQIIIKENIDTVLPTVGGQTALNCALDLDKQGILKKHNVKMIGAEPNSIEKAENRKLFNEAMAKIGLKVPRNTIAHTLEEALAALPEIGLPAIIRPSFTLGGSGGGIANTEEEYREIVSYGLDMSPANEVLIDQSILGWKEYEMEVVRDKNDNVIIVCSIENIDPMGVHTGDSITVAPALTLTDKEYQRMRDASIAVLREIGVETGGSNVQFAVNPEDGELVVIEMNPRVSRSSALASKATGFPIAKVAAKLAIGYTLDEIQNDITQVTPASFEPTIDYVVTKIPRFTFEKFGMATPELSSTMRSVGEAMSIGRSFCESLQKGLRSMETGLTGLNPPKLTQLESAKSEAEQQQVMREALKALSPDRILRIAHALRVGLTVKEVCQITSYDKWFVEQLNQIIEAEKRIQKQGLPDSRHEILSLKKLGFSDARLAELSGQTQHQVCDLRHKLEVLPVYKRVDTCAGEFESFTPYMYSCYEGDGIQQPECEANPSDKRKVVILGGGPNRIGQGIEFDYACVHAVKALAEEGLETIMVNCNPETVSTDYDTADRLYFEPLTEEDVIELITKEQQKGTLVGAVVQFGGQTPLKLSRALEKANIPIIGTSPDKIDLAEDRERFQQLLKQLNLQQPQNTIRYKVSQIGEGIEEIGYPVVIRPSNVLGGRAMEIVNNSNGLEKYLNENSDYLLDGPILIDKFLENAIEIDVDALSDGEDVYVAGIMEHIEPAGVHSGDSACSIPSHTLSEAMINKIRAHTTQLAKALNVIGLMNIQYAIKDQEIYVIEVNPRASRTVPFVAKATGVSIAKIAAKLMAGRKLVQMHLEQLVQHNYYAIKEVVFPFARFPNVDTLLAPEMRSTGEVMGIDKDIDLAFAKAQEGAGHKIPLSGTALVSVLDEDKEAIYPLASTLINMGFSVYATEGTQKFLSSKGLNITRVNKEQEGGEHTVKLISTGKIQLVVNTASGSDNIKDSYGLRRQTVISRIPYATTVQAAQRMIAAITKLKAQKEISIVKIQELTQAPSNAALEVV